MVLLSHLFGDGITLSLFQKNWAATACKNTEAAICPNNDVSYLFPQNNDATRRFVFDAKAIATLKAKATSSWVQNPTRAEAAPAVLCKSIIAAFKAKSSSLKPTLLTHLVNLRRKARPPLSEYSMGKIVWMANALCTDDEPELDSLVCLLREAIKKIDGDFMKSLQGDGGFLNFCEAMKDEIEACVIAANRIKYNSGCNFGFYDTDFGWGKPIWVSGFCLDGTVTKFSNMVILWIPDWGMGLMHGFSC